MTEGHVVEGLRAGGGAVDMIRVEGIRSGCGQEQRHGTVAGDVIMEQLHRAAAGLVSAAGR